MKMEDLEVKDFSEQNHVQQEEQEQTQTPIQDPFTSLMFGPMRAPHNQQQQHQTNYQSTIDYEQLMFNIDTLVESVRGLKPLFQQISPYIEQIWKKK